MVTGKQDFFIMFYEISLLDFFNFFLNVRWNWERGVELLVMAAEFCWCVLVEGGYAAWGGWCDSVLLSILGDCFFNGLICGMCCFEGRAAATWYCVQHHS